MVDAVLTFDPQNRVDGKQSTNLFGSTIEIRAERASDTLRINSIFCDWQDQAVNILIPDSGLARGDNFSVAGSDDWSSFTAAWLAQNGVLQIRLFGRDGSLLAESEIGGKAESELGNLILLPIAVGGYTDAALMIWTETVDGNTALFSQRLLHGQPLGATTKIADGVDPNQPIQCRSLVDGNTVLYWHDRLGQLVGQTYIGYSSQPKTSLVLFEKTADGLLKKSAYSPPLPELQAKLTEAAQSAASPLKLVGSDAPDGLDGGQGHDTIKGGKGNDKLEGKEGDDWLDGGLGKDVLTGGKGSDSFVFGAGFVPKGIVSRGMINANADEITDFVSGEDKIVLSLHAFHEITGKAGSGLTADQFGLAAYATTSVQRILYDRAKGEIWYDENGHASVTDAGIGTWTGRAHLATLKPGTELKFSDFEFVA